MFPGPIWLELSVHPFSPRQFLALELDMFQERWVLFLDTLVSLYLLIRESQTLIVKVFIEIVVMALLIIGDGVYSRWYFDFNIMVLYLQPEFLC